MVAGNGGAKVMNDSLPRNGEVEIKVEIEDWIMSIMYRHETAD